MKMYKNAVKLLILLVLFALICGGCGEPMSRREQVMFGAMVAANFADAYTTIEATEVDSRGGHFHEVNPILGQHPDAGNVILFKAGVVGVLWGLGEIWPEKREGLYTIGIVTGGPAAVWNWARNERQR
jgi:hypothetical protein